MATPALSSVTVGRISGLLNSKVRHDLKLLDSMARSGNFDFQLLESFFQKNATISNPDVRYYLASLLLQLDKFDIAREILEGYAPRREMKWYFAVLKFCTEQNLKLPKLSFDEIQCIDYLSEVVNPSHLTVIDRIAECEGFAVVGNAPGSERFVHSSALCAFYFNDYELNERITNSATIHVVTPSFQMSHTDSSKALCITGNCIFHRRSLVWRKFINEQSYQSIYTVPRTLWSGLSYELNASPSAGILILGWLASELSGGSLKKELVSGVVAGFSSGVPAMNHTYDSEPASKRHNWANEVTVRARFVETLKSGCVSFRHT